MINQRQRTLGEELKRYMYEIDKHKTIKQFAKDMNLHYNTLRNITNEELTVQPRNKTYKILAEYFNKDENYLRSLPYNYSQLDIDENYE